MEEQAPNTDSPEIRREPEAGRTELHATRVAVVILNWEKPRATIKCAESVLSEFESAANPADHRLYIVDNGSTDGSPALLRDWISGRPGQAATLLENATNTGFAAGMNRGIRAASEETKPDYFWLLNNDLLVEPGALEELLAGASREPGVAIWGPTVIDAGSGDVQCAGGCRYNRWLGLARPAHAGMSRERLDLADSPAMDYIYGAAMFIRGEFIRRINGLEESYFLFYEELDLVQRLLPGEAIGWRREAAVVHQGSTSKVTPRKSRALTAFHAALSAFRFTHRHCPACLPTVILARTLGLLAYSLRDLNPGLALAPWRALRTFFGQPSGLPGPR